MHLTSVRADCGCNSPIYYFCTSHHFKKGEINLKVKFIILSIVLVSLALFSGCSTGGSLIANNATNVELSKPNFNIIAENVQGYSKASYLIGFTYSTGNISNTLALARVGGTAKLYDDAIQNLWSNFREKYDDTKGRNFVLANIRFDNDMLNLLVYTQTELYITADVIEFVEE